MKNEEPDRDDLIAHLEAYLGTISGGFSFEGSGKSKFQIARFDDGLISDYSAIATIGVSSHRLELGQSGKTVRQEFLILIPAGDDPGPLPSLLKSVGEACLTTHRGYYKGDLIDVGGPVSPGSTCSAFFVAQPVYYPDEFCRYEESGSEEIIVVWLIPITAQEASFVRSNGAHRFEHELEKSDPDLTDLTRASVVE